MKSSKTTSTVVEPKPEPLEQDLNYRWPYPFSYMVKGIAVNGKKKAQRFSLLLSSPQVNTLLACTEYQCCLETVTLITPLYFASSRKALTTMHY